MSKKKKIIIILISVLCVLGLCVYKYSFSISLLMNWGFSIPISSCNSVTYSKESEAIFFGDGVRYNVITYKFERPISKMFEWQSTEENTRWGRSYTEVAEEQLDEIDVPAEERPDYTNCFYWYSTDADDQILFFWNKNLNKVYIIELFM